MLQFYYYFFPYQRGGNIKCNKNANAVIQNSNAFKLSSNWFIQRKQGSNSVALKEE